MEEEGYVSLWLGDSKTVDDYNKYLVFDYSEDGDFILPQFAKDFNISYFDVDLFEVKFFLEPINDLNHLLKGFSYDDILIEKFKNIIGSEIPDNINSVILLYDFKYDGNTKSSNKEPNVFNYIGTITLE